MVTSLRKFSSSPYLSIEYRLSSSSSSNHLFHTITSWRSLQEAINEATSQNTFKLANFINLFKKLSRKLQKALSNLLQQGIRFSIPEEFLLWFLTLIIDNIPDWCFYEMEQWEQFKSEKDDLSSFGLSSCGSWSSFMHRSASDVGPPPPPHGNLFLRSFSGVGKRKRKGQTELDQDSLDGSMFKFNMEEFSDGSACDIGGR